MKEHLFLLMGFFGYTMKTVQLVIVFSAITAFNVQRIGVVPAKRDSSGSG